MNWTVRVSKQAAKRIKRVPAPDRDRLRAALRQIAEDPFTGDIVRLKDHRFGWRRRVGEYRILYDLDPVHRFLDIGVIERRSTTTYR